MNYRKYIKIFLFLILSYLPIGGNAAVILLDPGHGGADEGAKNIIKVRKKIKYIIEKDLTLKLAKKVKHYLSSNNTVYLTRSIDRTVSLQKRADLAESIKADILISLHFNAGRNKRAAGFEIYYLNNHKDAAVKKMEEVENKNLKGEALIINQILTDLVIERTVDTSKKLAKSIHNHVKWGVLKKHKLRDRGVKPGLFYVLALSKRPGVLIETGFISNKKEANLMSSEEFLNKFAKQIAKGIDEYVNTNIDLPKGVF